MARRHVIIDMAGPVVWCRCGWNYECPAPGEYGTKSLADHLLDKHAEHAKVVMLETEKA